MSVPAAQPFAFGARDTELFGWWHAAAQPASLALVICSPFGNEEVFAHRALRHLAEASATAGVPALRFDYHGSGDSAGDELAPGRVQAWVDSVHQAIEAAKRHSGASAVCLLGVRLGATLAALAAASRRDVAGMVAIAPVVQGRAQVRELKMANMTAAAVAAEPTVPAQALLDSSNFVLAPEALAEIARIDLLQQSRAPATRMLVIERDDLCAAPTWVQRLRGLGVALDHETLPGYALLMNGHASGDALPTAIIERAVEWTRTLDVAALPGAPAAPGVDIALLAADAGVCEHPVRIDAGAPLFGIVSAPAGWPAAGLRAGARAVLLVPAGVGRRIGQGRLYVELARELAARGHLVLRLDPSGVGDSPAQPGLREHSLYEADAPQDIAAAIQHLCALSGLAQCLVVGHCSGAYNAFRCAVAGAAVSHVVQINPLVFASPDLHWLPGTGAEPLSHRTAPATGLAGLGQRVRHALARRTRVLLTRWGRWLGHGLRRDMRGLARRGVKLHYVFGHIDSGEPMLREYCGQAMARWASSGHLSVSRLPGADHIFTRWEHRQDLRRVLVQLLTAERRSVVATNETGPQRGPVGVIARRLRRALRAA